MTRARMLDRRTLPSALSWALLAATPIACASPPEVVVMHPDRSDGAAEVVQIEFFHALTQEDNFVMRPDEFGGAAVDHERGLVYVGSRDAWLVALDLDRGEVAWEEQMVDSVSGEPVLAELPADEAGGTPAGTMLIVGTDNGVLHALDPDTHETRWRYETPGRIRNAPIAEAGTVYFANSRDQIYALDARTGTWRWQYEQEFSNEFTVYGRAGLTFVPAGAEGVAGEIGTVYTGFDNGRVAALGATSGQVLWLSNIAPPEGGDFVDCDSTPWVDAEAGVVVVAGQSTGIHALSLADGSMQWRYPVEGASSVVRSDDGSYVAASSLQGVFALDSGGGLRWRTEVDPGVLRGPVVVGNTVFVTHADLGLLAFDALTGDMIAQLRTGSGVSTPPSFDPVRQRLYVTTNRGMFVSMRVGDSLLPHGDDDAANVDG